MVVRDRARGDDHRVDAGAERRVEVLVEEHVLQALALGAHGRRAVRFGDAVGGVHADATRTRTRADPHPQPRAAVMRVDHVGTLREPPDAARARDVGLMADRHDLGFDAAAAEALGQLGVLARHQHRGPLAREPSGQQQGLLDRAAAVDRRDEDDPHACTARPLGAEAESVARSCE